MDAATYFKILAMLIFLQVNGVSFRPCPLGQYIDTDGNRAVCVPCGHCFSGECEDNTGFCTFFVRPGSTTCHTGWKPPLCKQQCDDGRWGVSCNRTCQNCDGPCNKMHGTCEKCLPGFRKDTNFCNLACNDGDYGADCKSRCGFCIKNTKCDKVTGFCTGSCEPGYIFPYCTHTCEEGTYGENCAKTCGRCAEKVTCDYATGRCQLCAPGYAPPYCKDVCADGSYGVSCGEICGACRGNVPCNKESGHCPGECDGTVLPPLCKAGCKSGFYGEKCNQPCGSCSFLPCDETTGACPCPPDPELNASITGDQPLCVVCLSDYLPPLCKDKETSITASKQSFWLWIVLGLLVTFVMGITFFIVVRTVLRRRQKRQKLRQPRRSVRFSVADPPPPLPSSLPKESESVASESVASESVASESAASESAASSVVSSPPVSETSVTRDTSVDPGSRVSVQS